ncbi:aminopeptidase P family protein [Limoniibacter endophyticus]|uniref:Xaa-Pro aminopeptidase n=1 Tax=Limoniibacter endophyticus TaxID=1565040 RepID=A0A8J3DQY5_9HYPH|nr:aminopeptidase P family protein [Limoniibacter endophyticus]GHC75271.1 Xaa-Pro aminopeptidase [Limoniibacter endophyticus]
MFQSFEAKSDGSQQGPRIAKLRKWLASKNLDGFIVPRGDEHQGEYVADRSERLRWLTSFSGSAGAALIWQDAAQLFVDGRYTLQAQQQADSTIFTIESLVDRPPHVWLAENGQSGKKLAYDPWLHTISEIRALRNGARTSGVELIALDENPIDAIWSDQPPHPLGLVTIQPEAFAGELARDKIARMGKALSAKGATHAVLTDPSSTAWTFNIRGSDVPHTPLPLSFTVLKADGEPLLFLDKRKLERETEAYLTQLGSIRAPGDLEEALSRIAAEGAKVALDPVLAAEKLRLIIEAAGGEVIEMPDPARLPRAIKNAAEIEGSRAAHRRDGVAVTTFLAWLDAQDPETLDEIKIVEQLERTRASVGESFQMPLKDVSFDTIAGAGENGAIMHYRVTTASNRKVVRNELFLVDSGAQYQDGTTDITRTIILGEPTGEMRQRYTLVIKGLIAISLARFPSGTRGCDLDAFARHALWQHGLDFAHGTGHGVGSYLSVHEGPQRLAKTGTEPLKAGMILSNEPGYYKNGHYGIRLENLIVVTKAEQLEGGDIAMHGFETLTLAPFDRRLIDVSLLAKHELDWLNAYHARVRSEIGAAITEDAATLAWLEQATAPF